MNCKKGTEIVLSQVIEVLELIENVDYRQPLAIFNGSTFGNHFRHILDIYNCVIKGVSKGYIDYDQRERNPLIENNVAFAINEFKKVSANIEKLYEGDFIEIRADFTDEKVERPVVKSSIGRELLYAYDHAVHHLAMIKMGLRVSYPHITISERIGIAPSTLKHWQNN